MVLVKVTIFLLFYCVKVFLCRLFDLRGKEKFNGCRLSFYVLECLWQSVALLNPVVDKFPGNRELVGQHGQMLAVEPAAARELLLLQVDFPGEIVCCESNHHPAGIGPGL